MKYLVMFRRRDVPVPPEVVAEMLVAQRDWAQEKVGDGTLDCAYIFAVGGGGIGIVNADSGDELHDLVSSSPVFPITQVEIEPLAEVSNLTVAAGALQRAAGVLS
jgi:muconolactone delta-isomerase